MALWCRPEHFGLSRASVDVQPDCRFAHDVVHLLFPMSLIAFVGLFELLTCAHPVVGRVPAIYVPVLRGSTVISHRPSRSWIAVSMSRLRCAYSGSTPTGS